MKRPEEHYINCPITRHSNEMLHWIKQIQQDARNDIFNIEEELSAAYVRLRKLIGQEAFNTPFAPTAEQVWETTEKALAKLVEKANKNNKE